MAKSVFSVAMVNNLNTLWGLTCLEHENVKFLEHKATFAWDFLCWINIRVVSSSHVQLCSKCPIRDFLCWINIRIVSSSHVQLCQFENPRSNINRYRSTTEICDVFLLFSFIKSSLAIFSVLDYLKSLYIISYQKFGLIS